MRNEALVVAVVRTPIGKAPWGRLRHSRPSAVSTVNERMRAMTITAEQLIHAIRQFKLDAPHESPQDCETLLLYPAA